MSKFQLGDWVVDQRHPGVAREITDTRDGAPAVCLRDYAGTVFLTHLSRVTEPRPAKPRRTLTLSQGLAWLLTEPTLYLSSYSTNPAGGFGVSQLGQSDGAADFEVIGAGPTATKAIIAARKALKVKP